MNKNALIATTGFMLVFGSGLGCSTSEGGSSDKGSGGSTEKGGSTGTAGNGGTSGTSDSGGATGSSSAGKGGTTSSAPSTSGGATGSGGKSSTSSPSGGSGGTGGTSTTSAAGSGGSGGTTTSSDTSVKIPGETKPNVTAPASSKVSNDYFVMGETRLLNNNWGAKELGCNASYEIFVNADKTFGWRWDRNATKCGGGGGKPDYPEVEFGMHPFGMNKALVTSPDYSSTTVLPIQIKDVVTASVTVDGFSIAPTSDKSWNMNFEMWTCTQNPATGTHKTAYGETMNWFAWSSDQYGWNGVIGSLDAGQKYDLYVSRDDWPTATAANQWKYRQYRLTSPSKPYSGTVDVKKILDHLTSSENWPKDLWIARFEVGTELDDGSAGTVTIKNITFEVNGKKRSTEIR